MYQTAGRAAGRSHTELGDAGGTGNSSWFFGLITSGSTVTLGVFLKSLVLKQ